MLFFRCCFTVDAAAWAACQSECLLAMSGVEFVRGESLLAVVKSLARLIGRVLGDAKVFVRSKNERGRGRSSEWKSSKRLLLRWCESHD